MKRFCAFSAAALSLVGVLASCNGPSVPSMVVGEPTCPEFDQANERMRGGLKNPIRLRVLSGKNVIATVMVYGRPGPNSAPSRFLLPDANEEYDTEWTQCPNERAASSHDPHEKKGNQGAAYICENAEPYATLKHATKRGDPASHEIAMPAPPLTECQVALLAK